jgi:hypothetical protein
VLYIHFLCIVAKMFFSYTVWGKYHIGEGILYMNKFTCFIGNQYKVFMLLYTISLMWYCLNLYLHWYLGDDYSYFLDWGSTVLFNVEPWNFLGVKLTTQLHLVPRSRTVELYLHSPTCLHGIMLHFYPETFCGNRVLTIFRFCCGIFVKNEK